MLMRPLKRDAFRPRFQMLVNGAVPRVLQSLHVAISRTRHSWPAISLVLVVISWNVAKKFAKFLSSAGRGHSQVATGRLGPN